MANGKENGNGNALMYRVVEALVTAFIIGGIVLYGASQTVGVEMKTLKDSVCEVKSSIKDLTTDMRTITRTLGDHVAQEELLKDIRRDQIRREKKEHNP